MQPSVASRAGVHACRFLTARVLALVCVTVLVAAGCGGSNESGGAAGSPTTGADVQNEDLSSGGVLTLGSPQGIARLDIYEAPFFFDRLLSTIAWSALTTFTAEGGPEAQPDLAESWEMSADGRTYTFTLREGLLFSDGKPLTADAIAASLERAFDPKIKFSGLLSSIAFDKATAPDDVTVVIKLKKPSLALPNILTFVPIQDVATLDQIERDPITTGPFKVAEFIPDEVVELVPNENYYGEPPMLERIVFTKTSDSTAGLTSLRADDLQVMWNIPWTDVKTLAGSDELKVLTAEAPPTVVFFGVDNANGVFTNLKARQALAYIANRETINESVYSGTGQPMSTNSPVPPWSTLFADDLEPIPYDPEKAKQLFAEAGIDSGTKLKYWTIAGAYPEFTTMGQILQADLKEIGIDLEIETADLSEWAAKILPRGQKWPDTIIATSYTVPVDVALDSWDSFSETNFENEEYSAALDSMRGTLDEDERLEYAAEAQVIYQEQVPAAPLVATTFPVATRPEVGGIWIDPNGRARLEYAGYLK